MICGFFRNLGEMERSIIGTHGKRTGPSCLGSPARMTLVPFEAKLRGRKAANRGNDGSGKRGFAFERRRREADLRVP